MKRINKKWEAAAAAAAAAATAVTTYTRTHTRLQPPQPFFCKLFDVSLFLFDSQLWFWSRLDFLWHIWISDTYYESNTSPHREARVPLNFNCCRAARRTGQWQKFILPPSYNCKSVPRKWHKWNNCSKFPHIGVDFFCGYRYTLSWGSRFIILYFNTIRKLVSYLYWILLLLFSIYTELHNAENILYLYYTRLNMT